MVEMDTWILKLGDKLIVSIYLLDPQQYNDVLFDHQADYDEWKSLIDLISGKSYNFLSRRLIQFSVCFSLSGIENYNI